LKIGELTVLLLADVTYYNADVVTENHLRFVIVRHIACKRLVNDY